MKGENAFYTSKQNSDAKGMFYQWGRKDPFTFATSSEKGGVGSYDYGKYPVKIYTIDGVLIYQEKDGSSNKDKQPAGGIIVSSVSATSIMETVKKPIEYSGTSPVVSQVGHTRSLWDYHWVSYSRGTDGDNYPNINNLHNDYLEGYVSQRVKSIYDPCPYGFRVTSNGSYNQFRNSGWALYNYLGGIVNNIGQPSWFSGIGIRSSRFERTGNWSCYYSSTIHSSSFSYSLKCDHNTIVDKNYSSLSVFYGYSVRCIEFLSVRSDRWTRSNW